MSSLQLISGHSSRPRSVSERPFSHHAIMELVPPFSRRGYALDLAASDRLQRTLVFHPNDLAQAPDQYGALRCVLLLEQLHRAKFRLTRTLESNEGLAATAVADGEEPAVLLEAVERIETTQQFHGVGDVVLARSYRVVISSAEPSREIAAGREPMTRQLIRAEAQVGAVRLLVADEDERAFGVRLATNERCRLDITEDFLAVLGWRWRPLRRDDVGVWRGSVKPPLREPQRTAKLEAMLDTAVAHLSETLANPPTEFQRRHKGARWRAAFQRFLPLLFGSSVAIGFVVLVLTLPRTHLVHMVMVHVPVVAIVAMSLLDKAYRIEIPPLPRPPVQSHWCPLVNSPNSNESV